MSLERLLGEVASRRNDVGAKREVRHELAVHHVPLNEVHSGCIKGRNGFTQFGEINGQHRWGDLHRAHA